MARSVRSLVTRIIGTRCAAAGARLPDEVEPVQPRHMEVYEDHVDLVGAEPSQSLDAVLGLHELELGPAGRAQARMIMPRIVAESSITRTVKRIPCLLAFTTPGKGRHRGRCICYNRSLRLGKGNVRRQSFAYNC